ncbi:MAG: porin [Bdellovibrionaceae bacterium]|nr:porin [Pseudobdellovibrionaceae bacterium]
MKKHGKHLKKALVGLLAIGAVNSASAEESKEQATNSALGIEWNGYFDFYYQSSPQGHAAIPATSAGPAVVEGRYFDRHSNQMTLNMAELSLKKKTGKVSFRADLALGEMVDQLSGGGSQSVTGTGAGQNPTNTAANESTRNLTQATITYAATEKLSVTAGKFYTHMGLEVTKAKDNWQYSRSYTFNYGIPFWHEGISGTYTVIPDKFAGTIYLLNAWDGRLSQEQNKSTTVGANLNFTGVEGLVANYNYIGGAEATDQSRREAHEINLTYTVNPTIILATDYVLGTQKNIPTTGDAKWSGLAVYLKAALSSFYSISPRYEVFDDSDKGFAIAGGFSASGTKQKITSWTLANNFNLGDGLEARLELRSDKSDSNLFFKDKDGANSDHQESYTAAFLYSF